MFEGHPRIVTAQLEASQVELTVLHKRNGTFFDLTRIHFCVPANSIQPPAHSPDNQTMSAKLQTMSAKRSKTAQRLDEIVSNPNTISDVMIAIDRLNYILPRIAKLSKLKSEWDVRLTHWAWRVDTKHRRTNEDQPMKRYANWRVRRHTELVRRRLTNYTVDPPVIPFQDVV